MENHSYVAHYDERGRLNIWTSTQMAKPVQVLIAELFELPLTRVRLVQTTVGGGFGVRLGMIGEPHVCAMAMAVPGHPVRMEFLREEDWVASETRYPGHILAEDGFQKGRHPGRGRCFLSRHAKAAIIPMVPGRPSAQQRSCTACTSGRPWACRLDGYFTNEVPTGAYRGYGNPQITFCQEQMVTKMCKELGLDEVEWRKKWHKSIGDETWLKGVTYRFRRPNDCLDMAAKEIGWYEKKKKYAKQTGVKRRGIGLAVMNHTSGAFPMLLEHSVCTAKLNEDCTVELIQQISDLGTGGHTVITQMAAETLGFPMEDIHCGPAIPICADSTSALMPAARFTAQARQLLKPAKA